MTLPQNGTASENGAKESGYDSMVDIAPMLESLDGDARQATENLLTRALLYVEDADEALKRAMDIRSEAERYRAEVESETVRATEQFCAQLRTEAQEELDEARRLREEAEARYREAEQERQRAEAERAEAGDYRRRVEADAQAEVKAVLAQARDEAAQEAVEMKSQAAEEIRRAVAGIQKMKDAAQAELEAQKLYTEALRIKALAPSRDGATEPAGGANSSRAKARSRQRQPA